MVFLRHVSKSQRLNLRQQDLDRSSLARRLAFTREDSDVEMSSISKTKCDQHAEQSDIAYVAIARWPKGLCRIRGPRKKFQEHVASLVKRHHEFFKD